MRQAAILGGDLRGLLRSRGFRRSAPALVFTMLSLEDKGLVTCREEVRVVYRRAVLHGPRAATPAGWGRSRRRVWYG